MKRPRYDSFLELCKNGSSEEVAEVITRWITINQLGRFLIEAIRLRYPLKVLKILLDAGADVNLADENGNSPLQLLFLSDERMAEKEWEEWPKSIYEGTDLLAPGEQTAAAVQLFLDAGADLNRRDQYGNTPLMGAAGNSDAQSVALLLKLGADVNARNDYGKTPLLMATTRYAG